MGAKHGRRRPMHRSRHRQPCQALPIRPEIRSRDGRADGHPGNWRRGRSGLWGGGATGRGVGGSGERAGRPDPWPASHGSTAPPRHRHESPPASQTAPPIASADPPCWPPCEACHHAPDRRHLCPALSCRLWRPPPGAHSHPSARPGPLLRISGRDEARAAFGRVRDLAPESGFGLAAREHLRALGESQYWDWIRRGIHLTPVTTTRCDPAVQPAWRAGWARLLPLAPRGGRTACRGVERCGG